MQARAPPVFPHLQAGGQREHGHDLGGDGDVKASLPRAALLGGALAHGDAAERAVARVHDALPRDGVLWVKQGRVGHV